ncbi:MAG: hypothetical protein KGS61_15195, partial [Verrucomicrobia bacterium]|nr:hypothetical protein [Verrucomicrobiota bacterium]
RWLLPLRVHDQVIVVKVGREPGLVRRGDWIAYRRERRYLAPSVYLAGGYSIDQVRAVAGDRVRFTPDQFRVNDEAYPLLTNMPTSGEWVVPEKQWFVWPELVMTSHGVGQDQIAAAWRQAAFVDRAEYVGRAFPHWFWRRQSLP